MRPYEVPACFGATHLCLAAGWRRDERVCISLDRSGTHLPAVLLVGVGVVHVDQSGSYGGAGDNRFESTWSFNFERRGAASRYA